MAGDGGVCVGQQLADAVRAEVEVTVVAVVPELKKYLKERHPQGGIIWQSFQPEDISLENIPGWDPQG